MSDFASTSVTSRPRTSGLFRWKRLTWRLPQFQISIQAALSVGVALAVMITAGLVHISWLVTSRQNTTELNDRLANEVIRNIADKVDGLLESAVATRQAIGTNVSAGVVDFNSKVGRESFFFSFLQSNPDLSEVEFGWPDDRSLRVYRSGPNTIRMTEVLPGASQDSSTTTSYNAQMRGAVAPIGTETTEADYRPTSQFWYRTAFDVDRPVWSNIYPLLSRNEYGVATTEAITRNESLLGVVAVVLSLSRLSTFLDGIDITPDSSVFLTNTGAQLLAVQNKLRSDARMVEGLPRLKDVNLPSIQIAASAVEQAGLDLRKLHGTHLMTFTEDATGEKYFVTMSRLSQMGLIVGIVIPEHDVFRNINRNLQALLIILGAFTLIAVVTATVIARFALGRPLARVIENLKQLETFQYSLIRSIPSPLTEIRQVSKATKRMSASLASFGKYIPIEVVHSLFEQGIEAEPGVERRELSILFVDLVNFTKIAETLGDGIAELLSGYFNEMSHHISETNGTIDKYMGDGVMAFWGAPTKDPAHALNACRAALSCRAHFTAARAGASNDSHPLIRARFGINTGAALVGNFGSDQRLNYTAVGDSVNVASRLESLNRRYGTEIIIGEATYAQVREQIIGRCLDRVAVYGRKGGLEIYELLALKEDASPELENWVAVYTRGHAAMRARDWNLALSLFAEVIALRGGRDQVSSLHIERIRSYLTDPPPANWDGSIIMDAKVQA